MAPAKTSPMQIAVVVVVGLLAMLEPSLQLSLKNPLSLFRHSTRSEPKAYGIITNSRSVEKALLESREFMFGFQTVIRGRTFVIGRIYGGDVVFVRSSDEPSVNFGITVQIMIDYFNNIGGIIHIGSCGALDKSLKIGTVVFPAYVGFTGNLDWLSSDSNEKGQLQFAEYNVPQNGENKMGSLKYKKIDIYYDGDRATYKNYWVFASQTYLNYAERVQIDSGEVLVGMNASSSDIYVKNPTYGGFISKQFGALVVDTVSAAAGLGAKINGVGFISIQGVSNYYGENNNTEIASKNVAKAVIEFLRQATVPRSAAQA